MKNTNIKSYKGLFFREIYLAKNTFISLYSIWAGFVIVCILVYMSMDFGNLAKLSSDSLEVLQKSVSLFTYMPSFVLFLAVNYNIDVCNFDFKIKWRQYQHSTPISEWQFIGVKFITTSVTVIIGLILSVGNAFLMSIFSKKAVTKETIAIIFLIMALTVLLSMIMLVSSYIFYSTAVGGVVILIIGIFSYIFFAVPIFDKMSDNSSKEVVKTINNLCIDFMPFAVPSVVLLLGISYIVIVFLLKRREK